MHAIARAAVDSTRLREGLAAGRGRHDVMRRNSRVQPSSVTAPASLDPGLSNRRRRILEAAAGLFLRASYDAVQVDDIARVAGVAKPTLYRHFATKEALFLEALATMFDELKARAAAIAGAAEPPAVRLRALVSLLGAEIGRLKTLLRAAEGSPAARGAGGRQVLRCELRALGDEIARVIGDGIAAGCFAPTDARLAARVVLGGIRMASDGASHQAAKLVADLLLEGLVRRDRPPTQP